VGLVVLEEVVEGKLTGNVRVENKERRIRILLINKQLASEGQGTG